MDGSYPAVTPRLEKMPVVTNDDNDSKIPQLAPTHSTDILFVCKLYLLVKRMQYPENNFHGYILDILGNVGTKCGVCPWPTLLIAYIILPSLIAKSAQFASQCIILGLKYRDL